MTEPVVCAPNDPDDARLLSQVAGDQVDEVFIGSRMTNIGHFRATGNCLTSTQAVSQHVCGSVRLPVWTSISSWRKAITPSLDAQGARTEMPGCSLCMGNQARVAPRSTVLSTSTRNFPNRLGKGANVYLTSAELAAVGAIRASQHQRST